MPKRTPCTPYPVPGLTKHQRRIIAELCVGNYDLSCVFPHPRAIAKLLELGVIVRDGTDIPTYHVPLRLHQAWCAWCSVIAEIDVARKEAAEGEQPEIVAEAER